MKIIIVVLLLVIALGGQVFAQEQVEVDSQLSVFDYKTLRLSSVTVVTNYETVSEPGAVKKGDSSGFVIEENGVWSLVVIAHSVVPAEQDGVVWEPISITIGVPREVDENGNILSTDTISVFYLRDATFRRNTFFDGLVSWEINPWLRQYLQESGYIPLVVWPEDSLYETDYFISLTTVEVYDEVNGHARFIDPILYHESDMDTGYGALPDKEQSIFESIYSQALLLQVIDATPRKDQPIGVEIGPCLGYSGSPLIPVFIDSSGRLGIYTDSYGRPYVIGSFSSMDQPAEKYVRNNNGVPQEVACINEGSFIFASVFYNEE